MTKSKFKGRDDPAYREMVQIGTELYGPWIGWRIARQLWNQLQAMPVGY